MYGSPDPSDFFFQRGWLARLVIHRSPGPWDHKLQNGGFPEVIEIESWPEGTKNTLKGSTIKTTTKKVQCGATLFLEDPTTK